jgi:hypothetical protein
MRRGGGTVGEAADKERCVASKAAAWSPIAGRRGTNLGPKAWAGRGGTCRLLADGATNLTRRPSVAATQRRARTSCARCCKRLKLVSGGRAAQADGRNCQTRVQSTLVWGLQGLGTQLEKKHLDRNMHCCARGAAVSGLASRGYVEIST